MSKRKFVLLPLLVFAFALPASADVVIEFESGMFLKVHSYRLLQDQIRLHIAADSYLVVPRSTLAKIESDGRVVYRHPATPPTYLVADDDFKGGESAPTIAALAPASSRR